MSHFQNVSLLWWSRRGGAPWHSTVDFMFELMGSAINIGTRCRPFVATKARLGKSLYKVICKEGLNVRIDQGRCCRLHCRERIEIFWDSCWYVGVYLVCLLCDNEVKQREMECGGRWERGIIYLLCALEFVCIVGRIAYKVRLNKANPAPPFGKWNPTNLSSQLLPPV